MRDRPIIFSGPMVRAILDGRKTQTRRVLKPQPFCDGYFDADIDFTLVPGRSVEETSYFRFSAMVVGGGAILTEEYDPPYAPGDRLWVRETFRYIEGTGSHNWDGARQMRADGLVKNGGWVSAEKWGEIDPSNRWRSPMHMPRWASRITLIVEGVQVHRVQDISDKDAEAEGLSTVTKDGKHWKWGIADSDGLPGNDDDGWHWQDWNTSPVEAYARLWDEINAGRLGCSWSDNPWICAVSFHAHMENIDAI